MNMSGRAVMKALAESAASANVIAVVTERYRGNSDWLVIWGVGALGRSAIRDRHLTKGRVVMWDMGFFAREKLVGYCKVSVDQDYATAWLEQTGPEPARWDALGITPRNDFDPAGHIVLVGVGPKQHDYMRGKIDTWERDKLKELQARFPGKRIVYRPKPNRPYVHLPCETDRRSSIEDVLRGASLAVCLHSNVAIDAILAGVPFESETGVSTWLRGKPYTAEVRLDFLRRIARWQYRTCEMTEAWKFLQTAVA